MAKEKAKHAGGRPRTVSPEYDDLVALGKEMVEWVKKNDPLHLSQFYCIHKKILMKDWDTMIQRIEFVTYYEQAMRHIGLKYLDKNSNVREGASQRWQRIYFKDLKHAEDTEVQIKLERELEHKKALIDHDIKAKKEAISHVSSDIQDQFLAWNAQLTSLQSSFKMANNMISDESKS